MLSKMEYISIKNGYTKQNLIDIKEIIKSGKIAILPTDTVYGIAANALNEEAVLKIYKVKKRNIKKPMNILVSNIEMIRKSVKKLTKIEEKIIEKYFPGALTIIFEKSDLIPKVVTGGLDTIGIRMPENKFLLELIEELGMPIVATSCNMAGENPDTEINLNLSKIEKEVDLIVDEGKSKIGRASTIIKLQDEKIVVLREGPITKEEIEQNLK